ncbi:MAG TPA: prenyltransferase/squalene oxidase repeat-containing protein, partial [Pirellulales bacterium]|jgi:hypothetical protein
MVLIFLGLIYVTTKKLAEPDTPIQATVFGEKLLGDQLIEDNSMGLSTDKPDPAATETQFSPTDLPPVNDPLALPPVIANLTLHGGSMAFSGADRPADVPIGLALRGRERGMKKSLLAQYGGNATTEDAVHLALEWLKKNQRSNGAWSLNGPYPDGGEAENHIAATAMALLAFQGAGNTHLYNGDSKYDYKPVVRKGWDALIKMQSSDGQFVETGMFAPHTIYSHAQATIALCELVGMTNDSGYRHAAQKAIDFLVKSQDPAGGGWRYQPGFDSDTSVTGWVVMAMQSAIMAKLEVPKSTLQNITRYLDSAQGDGGSHYYYQPGRQPSPAMTAEGLLCRQYLGWAHDDPRLLAGADYISTQPIGSDPNVYYWYYATQVMHHMGGDYWKHWNEVMRQVIPETQTKKGSEAGSWDPSGDRWGQGGRLYVTCLRTYMLEVYYRHLPIYTNVYSQKAESGSDAILKMESGAKPNSDSADASKSETLEKSDAGGLDSMKSKSGETSKTGAEEAK